MQRVFVDTNFWIAILSPKDSLHRFASDLNETVVKQSSIVTSELVLVEVLNSFKREKRSEAKELVSLLRKNLSIEVVPFSPTLFDEALELYYSDKEWSLTDCTSFVIMRDRKIKDALTYDHHFVQAGFRALLRAK